jgi:hypothetical protein
MNLLAIKMAVDLTRREVTSAMPWAPVIDDRKAPRQPVQTLRATTARALRRTADRVDPKCAVSYG